MAKTSNKISKKFLEELEKDFLREQYLTATSGVVGAGEFFTEIQNRSPVIDPSKDLVPRMGVDRISCRSIFKIENEFGSNGEPVYGVENDRYNQIRFVGKIINRNDTSGVRIDTDADDNDTYAEITFYGTGLNWVGFFNGSELLYSVDGGAETPFIDTSAQGTNVLAGRNYSANNVINVVSGLALGIHTVKIRRESGFGSGYFNFSGFEILNNRTNILIPEGDYYKNGELLRHRQEETTDYSSGFENIYGSAGTKGGHVSIYLNKIGQIKKDIQYTDTTIQYLGNTDHSNEEIISKYNFREFGVGRSDDFSTLNTAAADVAFTLSDGTTTLVGNGADSAIVNDYRDGVWGAGNGDFIYFTFVGTGLDIINTNLNTINYIQEAFIDGQSIGPTFGGTNYEETIKICSGLPYGTHTFKLITNTASAQAIALSDFIVYGPKKPTLPEGAVELGSYYLLGNFSANTTPTYDFISQGTIRKANSREFNYYGTWTSSGTIGPTARVAGIDTRTTTPGSYFEYYFYGTGFDFRLDSNGTTTIEIDGSTDHSSLTTNHYGTGTWTPAAGTITGNLVSTEGITIDGLALGFHTVRVTLTSGTGLFPESLDIITPIHSHKDDGPFLLQSTLRVGNQSIGNSTVLESDLQKKKVSQTQLLANTNFSGGAVPGTALGVVGLIKLDKPGKVRVTVQGGFSPSNCQMNLVVNGQRDRNVSPAARSTVEGTITSSYVLKLPAGDNCIKVFYRTLSGSPLAFEDRTFITLQEIDD